MKKLKCIAYGLIFASAATSCGDGGRKMRTAMDITPGNPVETELDWRYGANDLRIQTTNINKQLMDRWFNKTGYDIGTRGKPRIIITEIDNRTDTYIPSDMVRDIFEGVAVNDGRYVIVVGDSQHEKELDKQVAKITQSSKYANSKKLSHGNATAPQFLAKVQITKATTMQPKYDIEDYRMTMRLYDIETQEIIDSAWDVFRKKIPH